MANLRRISAILLCAWPLWIVTGPPCRASETDQFLVWGVELEDSAPALNSWLNTKLDEFVTELDADSKWVDAELDDVAVGYYRHIFHHLLNQDIRKFLRESDRIHEYPPREEMSVWQYQEASIFRGRSFPYYLPMARTIRLGDVYLGTDKVSHMFGYGRRYFVKYSRRVERGMIEEEAQAQVIRWGLRRELSIVGRWVDGITSYADLEANYQGMRLAMDMCSESDPLFEQVDGQWRARRRIDILPYITPDFDESYNHCHYWLLRKRFAIPLIQERYIDRLYDADVRARFDRYRDWKPSLNMRVIEAYWDGKRRNPRERQSLENLYRAKHAEEP